MREIKFRFRLKNINEYVYWDKFKDILQDQLFDYFNSNNIIPEQFTGLLDKNGKEIYEGDILNEDYSNLNYVIEFREGEFIGINEEEGIGRVMSSLSICSKIIGNIHDNKDLLK